MQAFTIVTEFSGTRLIVVKKEDYTKRIDSVTKDSLQKTSFETYHFKVQPKSFWDKLLLTNEDGNLLSILFKIASALGAAWFIYNLQFDNLFSKKSFNTIWLTLFFAVGILEAYYFGASYTKDFWVDHYLSKVGNTQASYNFFGYSKIPWSYYWYIMFAVWLYRSFVDHHNEKPSTEEN